MHRLKIAGLDLKYITSFPSYMENLFADYSADEDCDECQKLILDPGVWLDTITDETGQGPEVAEFYALSVALGEQLPLYRRLQVHGVAIEYDGEAYIFSAPSGTGKSTRAFLWQKYLGENKVSVINGDKPILWFRGQDVLACGSPWAGKEGLHRNVCVPLRGICLLRRSHENIIRRVGAQEFFDFFITQMQIPRQPRPMMDALSLIEELYAEVPVFILENDMSERGVKVAYETLTGKNYEKNRI